MSWQFIFRVLVAFGFPEVFVQRIGLMFSSARISILHNGKLHGFFPCTRGVRQGDPLSPIIFGIAEDVLSRLLTEGVNQKRLQPMNYTRYIPFPSHLLYADDVLLFCKATAANATFIHDTLNLYGQLSGQICNPRKSNTYFGKGVPLPTMRRVRRILGFQQGNVPFAYLGVPLFVGHPRAALLISIKDKILSHFSKWKGDQLSYMGRSCLVASVVQGSVIHSMMVYRWPASLLHELDRSCRNFVWFGNIMKKPTCSVSWAKVCSPREEGGLGIRSFTLMNECFLSKLAWSVISNSSFVFQLLRAKHLSPCLRPKTLQQTSSIWTSIRPSFSRISSETFCCIGTGTSTLFWLDNWLGYTLSEKLNIPAFMHKFLSQTVSDYFYAGRWHFTLDFIEQHPSIVVDILLTPLSDSMDVRFWRPATHGQVTSNLMFSHITKRGIPVRWGRWIWDRLIPIRQSFICWRLIHGRLPTIDLLRRRGFQGPNFCILCGNAEESIDHIFWHCSVAATVWYAFLTWFGLQDHSFPDIHSFLVYAMNCKFSPQVRNIWKIGIINVIWYIWHTRNRCTWDDGSASTFHILKMTKAAIIERSAIAFLCICSNTWQDYIILRNFGVTGCYAPPTRYVPVSWWPPPLGWLKANTDGSAMGAPGLIGAGGVFRDALNTVHGCFHVNGGIGYAFDAELLAVITAIEIAFNHGWVRLWIETDSTYVAGLLRTRSTSVPWKFFQKWRLALSSLESMEIRVSHIFREGNAVADIMARPSTPAGWWPHSIPDIDDAVARDMSTSCFFRAV